MKFTELLKNWMDARDSYNAAKRSSQFDWVVYDELEGVMIAAERDLNDLVEGLQDHICGISETNCNA